MVAARCGGTPGGSSRPGGFDEAEVMLMFTCVDLDPLAGLEGPSDAELAVLVAEEHLIAAELARLDDELARLAGDRR